MSYKHLSTVEREKIAIYLWAGQSVQSPKASAETNQPFPVNWREIPENTCQAKRQRVTAGDGKNVISISYLKIRSCSRWSKDCSLSVIGRQNKSAIA